MGRSGGSASQSSHGLTRNRSSVTTYPSCRPADALFHHARGHRSSSYPFLSLSLSFHLRERPPPTSKPSSPRYPFKLAPETAPPPLPPPATLPASPSSAPSRPPPAPPKDSGTDSLLAAVRRRPLKGGFGKRSPIEGGLKVKPLGG